jgi:hypothetical protein
MRSPFSTDADREAAAPCLKVRRRSCAFLAGLLVATVISAPLAMAEPIMLRPGTNIYASGVPLDVGDHAIPCVADWNGDGRKDLLLGYRATDKVALYLNSGSDAQPAFTSFSNLQAGGVDIYQAGSGCGAPAPWVCDYDADGKRDLLVGNGTDGKVYFYRNTNTDAQPILSPGVSLMVGASPLTVTFRATPYVCD